MTSWVGSGDNCVGSFTQNPNDLVLSVFDEHCSALLEKNYS